MGGRKASEAEKLVAGKGTCLNSATLCVIDFDRRAVIVEAPPSEAQKFSKV